MVEKLQIQTFPQRLQVKNKYGGETTVVAREL